MYGKFHITFVICTYLFAILLANVFKNTKPSRRYKILGIIGFSLSAVELYKQWYLTFVINHGTYDWFHFPLQLCSLPMYLCMILPHVKNKKGIEAFLFSFGLFAASFALAYPQDMLSADLFLLLHSFLYHGVMVFISVWIAVSETMEWKDFRQAVRIFLVGAVLAEGVNTVSYLLKGNADMFYISPFQQCQQPVFREIALLFGRPFEILFYLLCIVGANILIFYIYRILLKHHQ